MRAVRVFVVRLAALFTGSRREREIARELESHLQLHIDDNLRAGMTPAEARRQALVKFGGIESIKEQCRDVRGIRFLEDGVQDIRYGLRAMHRSPAFTLTATLTLALTIGAVSTVLTIADTLFLRYLPVSDPEELVEVTATRRNGTEFGVVSYPAYLQFRDASRTLTGLAAHYSSAPLFVTMREEARQINGAVVSANFFALLGVQPALGRFFGPEDDRVPDRDRVAVIAH